MLRKIINKLDSFEKQEKDFLISFVEDVYFYWNKYEILDDAIEIVHNFYKPNPINYYGPLSKFPRLDRVINYNAYVVAFVNLSSFFESKKKRKDDRFLNDFIQRCLNNVDILYKLKVELYKINHLMIPYDINHFNLLINEMSRKLNSEIEKKYIKEIKTYRNKVLSHHTFFKESDIGEKVSDYLMDAKKFLTSIITKQLGEIITHPYSPRHETITHSIDLLRKVTKPDLEDIVKGKISFPEVDKETINNTLKDDDFTAMINKFTNYSISQTDEGLTVVDFIIKRNFYERNPRKGIDIKFVGESISKLMKKYKLDGINIVESIVDH